MDGINRQKINGIWSLYEHYILTDVILDWQRHKIGSNRCIKVAKVNPTEENGDGVTLHGGYKCPSQ